MQLELQSRPRRCQNDLSSGRCCLSSKVADSERIMVRLERNDLARNREDGGKLSISGLLERQMPQLKLSFI